MHIKQNLKLCEPSEEYTFKIVACGNALCGKEWCAHKISPPYTRLYYMIEGKGLLNSEEGVTEISAGNLYIIPAGYTFSYSCNESLRQLYFHINLTGKFGHDLLRGVNKILSLKVDKNHLNELLELFSKEDKTSNQLLKAHLQKDLFTAFADRKTPFNVLEPSDCVKKAVIYIENNLSMTLTVSEIAEKLFVSPNTLSHRFKKEMGEPVGKYIDSLIFYKAEQLLMGSELSVAQISAELGFYDRFYFSRRFKEKFGIPPLIYRKSHKENLL